MDVVSVRVDEETRKKMRLLSHMNWSEVIRGAIKEKVLEEETKERRLSSTSLATAAMLTDELRRPSPSWSSVEEIRGWRGLRK
ncbi:MAG: VapB-type antitoxin [Candidatus Hadarchaeota archaeon]|nr:VapB-type antitoxin [Candidatus Hadarchaeota archaeon]